MEVITVLTGGAGFEDAAEYLPYVSALRRDRIARKRSGSDKLLSLTAGLLISLEVTRRTGIPRGSIRYVHGAFGKPYLDGSTLQFSLSHTKGAVCAVFSDGESGEVGVDIERRDRRVSERIRERILSENEKLLVSSTEDLLRLCGPVRDLFWGGYPDAERAACVFLPDWQEAEDVTDDPEGPVAAVEGTFPTNADLGHRDVLGALMGLGITREKLGDILFPEKGRCQVAVLREALPILLSQWEGAGRWKISVGEIPVHELRPAQAAVKTIRDTVATPRLDAVLVAGFSLSRSKAAGYVSAGKVAVNHRECLKGDHQVEEGDVLTCRGLGKCVVKEVPGQSRKGRTMLVLERYI